MHPYQSRGPLSPVFSWPAVDFSPASICEPLKLQTQFPCVSVPASFHSELHKMHKAWTTGDPRAWDSPETCRPVSSSWDMAARMFGWAIPLNMEVNPAPLTCLCLWPPRGNSTLPAFLSTDRTGKGIPFPGCSPALGTHRLGGGLWKG